MAEMDVVPVFRPLLEVEEKNAAREALDLGWLGMGSYVGQFEAALANYLQLRNRHVVALSTGHAAIHLALLLCDIGPGDEVITPSFNNVADFQAILATGATPVFCDIDERTLCIDVESARAAVSTRTKGIIAMDYDCLLCDHAGVNRLANEIGVRVIHDAAHSFGSRSNGTMVGASSDIAMFSFDPVKTITCIDGGAIVVKSDEERGRLHEMRLIGMGQPSGVMYQNTRAWTYDVRQLGFRYHMANLHAAIGLAQLAKIDKIASSRRATSRAYNEAFRDLDGLVVPQTEFDHITPFLYYVRILRGRRDLFRAHLQSKGIDTGIHWQPGHTFSLFKECRRTTLPVTERIAAEVVSLPLHSQMSQTNYQRVIDAVISFFK